jgi:hypothetical protein
MSIHANPVTGKFYCAAKTKAGSYCGRQVKYDGDTCFAHKKTPDIEEPPMLAACGKFKRDFLRTAKEILGYGYTDEYYDQMICSELRMAFELGWREARKR